MIREAIKILAEGRDLRSCEASAAMACIMEGGATPAQIGSFIMALRIKGETTGEITGCAEAMRAAAEPVNPGMDYCIDTCGTGGDGSNSYNISTAAAIIAAAGGVGVAKHGNRSVSSKCGSADVFEALGIDIHLTPAEMGAYMARTGIGFLFAQTYHKSMKYAAAPRKELGIRTIFNILGPLCNPAHTKGQVLGVFDGSRMQIITEALRNLGVERALVVHGEDGMDEITLAARTRVSELRDGTISEYVLSPEDFGIERAAGAELEGGGPEENAEIIRSIFRGELNGPKRNAAVLNAGAALYVGKAASSINDGVSLAGEIIDSGRAAAKLEEMKAACLNA